MDCGSSCKIQGSYIITWLLTERDSRNNEYASGSQQRIERSSNRIFGRIPDLQINVPNQTHGDPEFSLVNSNNIYASSTEQQLYHQQLQVQQHYRNPFLSGQNIDGGRLQQQNSPLFDLEGPSIRSTNSNFYMAFNSGAHHDYNLNCQTQNGYILDLNQAYVSTNSTSAMMTDMNGGNVIIIRLGVANNNFQQYIGE
ncbi:hypothetical protein H5410_001794 [Solanum commersonii]|uniref:Uncharacterized protein n=1 Tax=Solanum commersonii TaxID=4109 RepID=A0A9J6AZS0_SOLCO|nr:hypothetical protein H5410_001794 [Solanum commersonii]